MVESATSQRSLSGAEEFDRRMRTIAQTSTVHSEALAELARLVGQQDPFGETAAPPPPPDQPHHDEHAPLPPLDFSRFDVSVAGGLGTSGPEAGAPGEPPVVQAAAVQQPEPWELAVPRYPSFSVRDPRPIEPSPDAWAQAAGEDESVALPIAPPEARVREPAGPKRTLVVLAAVVVLTGGGLAASFLTRPSGGVMAVDRAPTILAASGPSKVQPETTDADAPSAPSTLLDKNKNDGTAAAKLVDNVEQPVDLGQAMKPAAVSPAAPPPSPFPEPHKVKTVLVRPDGSLITDTAPAVGASVPGVPADQDASLAFDPTTAMHASAPDRPVAAGAEPSSPAAPVATPSPPEAVPARKPPLSKTTARIPAAKAASSTSQGGSAAAEGRSPVATPKAKPIVHARLKPKPAEAAPVLTATAAPTAAAPDADAPPTIEPAAADAAPSAATPITGAGGHFAVQLGATPSLAEGQAAATRLGQKYAGDLGGSMPSVHKADAGGKTVYRIRVGNLSQEDAKAICAKVAAGGGGCFVARN